jgi:hypothetical protein
MVVDVDNGGLDHAEEDRRFDQDEELLAEYPEMVALSGFDLPPSNTSIDDYTPEQMDALAVSAAFVNGRTGERFIDDVEAGKPTGSVEYLLQVTGESLDHLAQRNNPGYQRFIDAERAKLEERHARAKAVIGDKKRDTSIEGGGRYK